jgi:23S rRNA (guanosine2251-2'-O)-methyltransferase
MADPQYKYYECENPDCRLRFPGYEGYPRWNKCPVCRSNTHLVAVVQENYAQSNTFTYRRKWRLEALLDNIRSSWNVGSIFRSADGTGIQKIYLCGISPTPENPKVRKTALGAEENIPWVHSKNGVETAINLKSQGRKLWVLEDIAKAVSLFNIDLPENNSPVLLIFGNEVSGVDPDIIEICDQVISIPMVGKKKSYNVATAFGIAASFLLYRQSFSQGSFNIFPSI